MALFSRSASARIPAARSAHAPLPPPLRARELTAPGLLEAREAALSGRHDTVLDVLGRRCASAEVAGAARYDLVDDVAELVPFAWAAAAAQARPDRPSVQLLAGASAVRAAWRVRGRGMVDTVSRTAALDFQGYLGAAEVHLLRAAEADSGDPTPLVLMLRAGRGLGWSTAELGASFEQLADRDPWHLEGHRQLLQGLCDKWGGSHEQMFSFARDASGRAPAGSPLHELVLVAHLERHAAIEVPAARAAYLRSAPVRAELAEAMRRLGPASPAGPEGDSARNVLAYLRYLDGDLAAFVEAVHALGGVVTPEPWIRLGGESAAAVERCWRRLHDV